MSRVEPSNATSASSSFGETVLLADGDDVDLGPSGMKVTDYLKETRLRKRK